MVAMWVTHLPDGSLGQGSQLREDRIQVKGQGKVKDMGVSLTLTGELLHPKWIYTLLKFSSVHCIFGTPGWG